VTGPGTRPDPFERRDHYSYKTYANPVTARTFDDLRFGGPIGDLIASTQARVLANMIGRIQDRVVLDVGTGTGRAALILARGGAQVTAVDASEQMLSIARHRAEEQRVAVRFLVGDAHALDFADRAFDVSVSLRVLMHTPDWARCLAELCRVSERLVIFDYPSATSFALLDAMARRVVQAAGGRIEAYRVFTNGTIVRTLEQSGFRVRSVHRQFVLPIRLHKAIGSRRFTEFTEDVLDRMGLLRQLGSPVTICAERCVSS